MSEQSLEERVEKLERRIGTRVTQVSVIQDASSSMSSRRDATISGFNEYLSDLQKDEGADYRLTLTQFDTRLKVVHEAAQIGKVSALDRDTYNPGGATALYDAICTTIKSMSKTMGKSDRALVLIMTDGEENSSTEYNRQQTIDLIDAKQEEGNWTFVFMGADQDAWAMGTSLGIPGANTLSYANTDQGIGHTHSVLSSQTRSLAASGEAATLDFFEGETKESSTTDNTTSK